MVNANNRLFDLALRMEDAEEAKLRCNKILLSHQIKNELTENEVHRSNRLKLKYSLTALLSYVEEDYDDALKKFAQFIDYDFAPWGALDQSINLDAINTIVLARDYYYAGKSLLHLGYTLKARDVFDAGLELTSKDGNLSYQKQIREELALHNPENQPKKELIP